MCRYFLSACMFAWRGGGRGGGRREGSVFFLFVFFFWSLAAFQMSTTGERKKEKRKEKDSQEKKKCTHVNLACVRVCVDYRDGGLECWSTTSRRPNSNKKTLPH
jgi:hypothetical protein